MTSPFLKAVGGKGGVLGQIEPHLPPEFSGYGETFLGGGALYFSLLPSVGNVVLADSNARLIDAYLAVRDDVDGVIEALREFRYPDSYYAVRDEFNARTGTLAQRAAMFIYLSKTCYNGLYRVNRRGQFNVPVGRYTNPAFCDEEALRAASRAIQGREFLATDFEALARSRAKPGELWYFDPPYVPTKKGSFVGYSKEGFGETDQRRLAALFRELSEAGVLCLASNSDVDVVRDLYAGFDTFTVYRKNNVNSDASARGRVSELLIRGWK